MYHVIVYISLRYFPVVLIEPLERNESTRFFEHIRELFFGINFAKSFILYYNIKINCLRARVVHYIFVYYLSVLVVYAIQFRFRPLEIYTFRTTTILCVQCTLYTIINYIKVSKVYNHTRNPPRIVDGSRTFKLSLMTLNQTVKTYNSVQWSTSITIIVAIIFIMYFCLMDYTENNLPNYYQTKAFFKYYTIRIHIYER